MVIRRCPKCHSNSDDKYGFCIKCGYEFPELNVEANTCPLCNYSNPDEADPPIFLPMILGLKAEKID